MQYIKKYCFIFLIFTLPSIAACSKNDATAVILSPEEISALIRSRSKKNPSESALWAKEIRSSLDKLDLQSDKENVCAVIAVIEQESSFNADPVVQGLARILNKWISKESSKPGLGLLLNLRLDSNASNNRTFRQNINKIRTERDLEQWYHEFTYSQWGANSVLKFVDKDIDHLISTLGSMQVSISFSRKFADNKNINKKDLREYLYSMEGGVYFGAAHLLYNKVKYSNWKFRFADYNAGLYSSRNAGFQFMLAKLSSMKLALDGDLLTYKSDKEFGSKSFEAARAVLTKFNTKISDAQLLNDFKKEKDYSFIETPTYKAIAKIYTDTYQNVVNERIPEIQLQSDKLTKKRTTEWYASTVSYRFDKCRNTPYK